MMDAVKKIFAFSTILLILVGCSTLSMDTWSDPEISERPLGKVMVLAIAEQATTCRLFEGHFTEQLAARGVDAVSGHVVLPADEDLSREQLEAALKEGGYDSLVLTRLLNESIRNQVVHAGYTTSYPAGYGHYYDYYAYGVIEPVTYVDSYMEYRLETNVFDVQTGKMVWGGTMSVYDTSSEKKNIKKVVNGVIRDLEKKRLL